MRKKQENISCQKSREKVGHLQKNHAHSELHIHEKLDTHCKISRTWEPLGKRNSKDMIGNFITCFS